jgi:sugar lactone lactonase YvrE
VCRRAKEALSTDSDTTIPVALPGLQTEVRLTRDEFETMIRPRITETVRALERAVASAHIEMDQISRVLLVGGSSRMPIVAELVRSTTGRQVSLDAHPKLAIAVGAALAGAAVVAPAVPTPAGDDAWQAPVRQAPVELPPTTAAKPRNGRRFGPIVGVGAVVGAVAVVAIIAMGGGSNDGTSSSTTAAGVVVTSGASSTTAGRGVDAIVDRVAFGETGAGTGIPGPALAAGVSGITSVAVDASGSVYVATLDSTVLRVTGTEVALAATLDPAEGPAGGLAVANDGSVLVSTSAGVRSFAGGVSTLLLDAAANGLGATPGPIALDGVGNLYVADNDTHRIIRRSTDGSLSLIAGSGIAATAGGLSGDGQNAGIVAIGTITGLAIDGRGNLIFTDATLQVLGLVSSDGTMSTIAGGGTTPLGGPGAWVADGTPGREVIFGSIDGLTVDVGDRAYITDSTSGAVVRIDTGGTIELVITRTAGGSLDGVPASDSSVGAIGALVIDRSGTLFFVDGVSLRGIAAV